jgi:hypothetical protein
MSVRDEFLELIKPTFIFVRGGSGWYLITAHNQQPLANPIKLLLDRKLFARYVRRVRKASPSTQSEEERTAEALTVIYRRLQAVLSSSTSDTLVRAVGLRRDILRRPMWFSDVSEVDPAGGPSYT